MRLPIRWRLILAIGLPAVAVWAAMSWILAEQAGRRNLRRLEEQAGERIATTAALVDARLRLIGRAARQGAAGLERAQGLSDSNVRPALEAALETEPLIRRARVRWKAPESETGMQGMALTRSAGGFEATSPGELSMPAALEPAPRGDPASAGGASGWTSPYLDATLGGKAISLAAPFAPAGGGEGTFLVDLLLADLGPEFPEDLRKEGAFVLAGSGGVILYALAPEEARLPEATSIPEMLRDSGRSDLLALERRIAANETGIARAPGLLSEDQRWFAFAPVPSVNGYLIASVPESVVLAFSRSQIYLAFSLLTAGLIAVLGIIVVMSTRITDPLSRLARAVGDLGTGNLGAQVTGVPPGDEIGDLAGSFNRMVADLNRHVEALQRETAAREKVEGELRVARGIQTALLPKRLPTGEKFEISASNLAARHVAGDFYDAFFRDKNTLVFLVADVSGKGLPAALFMAVSRTVIRRLLKEDLALSEVLAQANAALEGENVSGMYVTLFVGVYDVPSGTLRYANAAHPVPHRIDASGRVSELGEVTGTMVGLLPARTYEERQDRLGVGDRIVVVTDGVPEAKDAAEEFFGEERLDALLQEAKPNASADSLRLRVLSAVEGYQGPNLADDVTVLVLGRLG